MRFGKKRERGGERCRARWATYTSLSDHESTPEAHYAVAALFIFGREGNAVIDIS